jgi:hypothetical protein
MPLEMFGVSNRFSRINFQCEYIKRTSTFSWGWFTRVHRALAASLSLQFPDFAQFGTRRALVSSPMTVNGNVDSQQSRDTEYRTHSRIVNA